METVTRIKKTMEIVQRMGPADSMHTYCLFATPNAKHRKGVIQSVRNDNLMTDKDR